MTDGASAGATVTEEELRRRAADITDETFEAFLAQKGASEALDEAYSGKFGAADRELQKGMIVIAHERALAARAARASNAPTGAAAPAPAGSGQGAGGGQGGGQAGQGGQGAGQQYTEAEVVKKGEGLADAVFEQAIGAPGAVNALDQAFGGRFSTAPREIQKGLVVLFAEAQAQAAAAAGKAPPELPDQVFEDFISDPERVKALDQIAMGALKKTLAELPRETQKQLVAMTLARAAHQRAQGKDGAPDDGGSDTV